MATRHAQERMGAEDLSPAAYRQSVADGHNIRVSVAVPQAPTVASIRSETESNRNLRLSTIIPETYLEEDDTAKIALAICHRDEDKTEDVGEGEDARTEEAAMIKAAAR